MNLGTIALFLPKNSMQAINRRALEPEISEGFENIFMKAIVNEQSTDKTRDTRMILQREAGVPVPPSFQAPPDLDGLK